MNIDRYNKLQIEETFESLCISYDYLKYSSKFIEDNQANNTLLSIRNVLESMLRDFPSCALRCHSCYNHDWYDDGVCQICGNVINYYDEA